MSLNSASSKIRIQRSLILGMLLMAFLIVIIGALWPPGHHRHLRVSLQVTEPSVAQLFYAINDSFSESQSIRKNLHAGSNILDFKLPYAKLTAIRFDPGANDSPSEIRSLVVSSTSGKTREIPLAAFGEGANASIHASTSGLRIVPSAGTRDPQVLVSVPREFRHAQRAAAFRGLILAGSVGLLLVLACIVLGCQWRSRTVMVWGMSIVAGLIVALAAVSPVDRSVSPDEFSHKGAYEYYLGHMLPPAVDEPTVVPSLSVYGYSYLMEWDVAYWVAARVTSPLVELFSNDLYAARAFNVALWLVLLLLVTLRRGAWPWAISVLLLTPQAWYVFAYFNGDAFPLFLAIVCAALIAAKNDAVGMFVQGARINTASVVFIFAFGLLLVSKRNFLPLLPAFALWLAALHLRTRVWSLISVIVGIGLVGASVQLGSAPSVARFAGQTIAATAGCLMALSGSASILWASWKSSTSRKSLVRVALLVFGALLVATPRIVWDLAVNGTPGQKHQRMLAVADAHAGPGFRPSEKNHGSGIRLAEQGLPLHEVFAGKRHWLRTSTMSAFGVYGYMNAPAPAWTFPGLILITLLISGIGLRSVLRNSPNVGVGLCLLVLGASLLVAMASLLHSWVGDYQPQGRYLLPILPLIGLVLAHSRSHLPRSAIRALLLISTLIGIYSFAFTALPALA